MKSRKYQELGIFKRFVREAWYVPVDVMYGGYEYV